MKLFFFLLIAPNNLVLGDFAVILNNALQHEPDVNLHVIERNKGIHFATKGDPHTALKHFLKAAELASKEDFGVLNDLGVTYMRVGNLEAARENMHKALALSPGNKDTIANLDALQQHQDYRDDLLLSQNEDAEEEEEEEEEDDNMPHYGDPSKPRKPTPRSKPRRERSPPVDGARASYRRAIDLGGKELFEEALESFQNAYDLGLTGSVGFLSDWGVTLMHANLIDESREVFDKGLALENPDPNQLIGFMENLAILGQHEDFRRNHLEEMAEQQEINFGAGTYDMGGDDDEDDNDEDDKDEDKDKDKDKDNGEDDNNIAVSGLLSWFNSAWANSESAKSIITEALLEGKPVVIRNFLHPKMAKNLANELTRSRKWKPFSSFSKWAFQYSWKAFHPLKEIDYEPAEEEGGESDLEREEYVIEKHPMLNKFCEFMDSEEVKDLIGELSGSDSMKGKTDVNARMYTKFDFSTARDDLPKIALKKKWGQTDEESDSSEHVLITKSRKNIGFIVTLTNEWEEKFGGDTVIGDDKNNFYHVPPTFNTLILLPVNKKITHHVSPINPKTPRNLKRLELEGVFYKEKGAGAGAGAGGGGSKPVVDEKALQKMLVVLDGKDGEMKIFEEQYFAYGDELWPPKNQKN